MPNTKKIIKPKTLVFKDHPEFSPNLTLKQVLQSGAFEELIIETYIVV